ncbi:MAG TPA: DNA sulfur modification protein DndB [Solirubrobacteraceae bacterium]|nr:DNA sulfur modification protein DndB [Solirubrobacteraceae bacterium]
MQTYQALEGRQGGVRFFTANVPVGELEHMVRFPEDLGELDEDQEMQRGFNRARVREMVEYLKEPDHFYSAVTLIILPRDLDRPTEEIQEEGEVGDFRFVPVPDDLPGRRRLGLLHLSGDVVLFPGDGQHRLRSEFDGLDEKIPGLAKEDLPVVLVPFESADQVRQLFSDLNLNAKPVSKTIGYAFEKRDPLVQIAKSVADEVPLFVGRVNRRTNSLSKTSTAVITLGTLVPSSKLIAEALAGEAAVDDYLAKTEVATGQVGAVWGVIIDAFASYWHDVLTNEPGAAGELREEYLFPHGLGWRALAQAAAELIEARGRSGWEKPFRTAVRSLDWKRTAAEWNGTAVIHDPEKETNRVNNTGPAVRQLAEMITQFA